MCKICGQHPCDTRCPNADEPLYIGKCQQCGALLREDYEYWSDEENGMFCSEECAKAYYDIHPTYYDE